MLRTRPRQYYSFQNTSAAPPMVMNQHSPQTLIAEPMAPSALRATVSVSGSVALIGGTFALAYGWSYQALLPFVAFPWAVYAIGKGVYLVIVLISDIASLFEPSPAQGGNGLLSIVREND